MTSSKNEWLPETKELFCRLESEGGMLLIRSDTDKETFKYSFMRICSEKGPAFHYAAFLHDEGRRLRGLCQFSEDTCGLKKGFAHAGAIATMLDCITAALATHFGTRMAFTVDMNVIFKRLVPVVAAILIEGRVEKVEGQRLFVNSRLKTPDDKMVYSECQTIWKITERAKL